MSHEFKFILNLSNETLSNETLKSIMNNKGTFLLIFETFTQCVIHIVYYSFIYDCCVIII